MDIPRERIVGLIARGLITGALLRVIYQALQERPRQPLGYVQAP